MVVQRRAIHNACCGANSALTVKDFQAGWLEHARVGLPWAVDCGMSHYVQIVDPFVANPAGMPEGVKIGDFDAACEIRIPENAPGSEKDQETRGAYFERVIIPDECKYFAGPNRDLAVWVPPGTVTGKRIEVLVNGKWVKDRSHKLILDLEQSAKDYMAWKEKYEAETSDDTK